MQHRSIAPRSTVTEHSSQPLEVAHLVHVCSNGRPLSSLLHWSTHCIHLPNSRRSCGSPREDISNAPFQTCDKKRTCQRRMPPTLRARTPLLELDLFFPQSCQKTAVHWSIRWDEATRTKGVPQHSFLFARGSMNGHI